MKVAVVFWGLCRSTEFTIESLKQTIFDIFDQEGIDYSIYLHTWNIYRKYHNPRAGERNVFLKNTTWKYLNPTQSCIENQDMIDPFLHMKDYRSHGDPWMKEKVADYTPFTCVDNVVRALYSMKKATDLWVPNESEFDVVLYVRPDVRILQPFQIEWLYSISDKVIYIPDFHLIDGVNDRFAFGKPSVMKVYGLRYTHAKQYAQHHALHSEKFLAHILKKNKISTCLVPFRFRRIRAGGTTYDGDRDI